MRPSLAVLVTATALLAACDQSPTQPGSSPFGSAPPFVLLGNVRVPISATLTTCDNDVVELSGVGHFHNTSTVAPDGSLHITNHVNVSGRGTAASGARYLVNESNHLILNLRAVPGEITEVEHLTLIGQGGAQNLLVDGLFHITVNAQGVLAVAIDKLQVVCPA
jgi:hypothetical protein